MDLAKFSLSASKVDTFLGCRRLFKYRYLATPPIVVPKSKHFVIGNIAHKTLELFHRSMMAREAIHRVTEDRWGKILGDAFREAHGAENVPIHLADGTIEQSDLLTIKGMLKNYLTWYRSTKPDRIFALEKYFQFKKNGITVSGKADRVDLSKKFCLIVDYKTNKQPYRQKDINESVQLQTYAIWIRSAYPQMKDIPIKGKYLFLRHLAKNGVKQFPVTQDMMDAAWAVYENVYDMLAKGCDFPRNSLYKYCLSCEFRNFCFSDSNNSLGEKE